MDVGGGVLDAPVVARILRADIESAPTNYQKAAANNKNCAPPNHRVLAPGRGQSVRSWILKENCAERRSDREAGRAVSLKPGLPRYRK